MINLSKQKESFRVELDAFSGPLELLLHLIKSEEIDIYNIPIIQITGQYLDYLKVMKDLNLNIAGEFLVVASTLMYIKSKMLLPEEPGTDDEEKDDLRTELVEALLEYKRYKQAAEHLNTLVNQRQEIFNRGEGILVQEDNDIIDVDLFGLISAFKKVLDRVEDNLITEISRSPVTVEEKIEEIMNILKEKENFSFGELFENVTTKIDAVVCFLALLELIKQRRILARQNSVFGEIRIFRKIK